MNAPERVIPDGIEPYYPQQSQQSQHTSIFIQPDSSSYQPVSNTTGGDKYSKSQFEFGPEGVRQQDRHRIGGLRRRWFWLLIALIAVVIVGASVGGAVGGAQAKKSSGSGSSSSTTSSSSSNAITDCPSVNGQTYTPGDPSGGAGLYTFTKTCGAYDTDGTNLESASVATFDDCIALCSNWNYWAEPLTGIQCTSVVYLGDTSCYAKNGTQTVNSTDADVAVALLNS